MDRLESVFIDLKSLLLDVAAMLVPTSLLPVVSAVITAVVLLALGAVIMMYQTWLERKVVGRMQDRYGPNRVGPFGLLQPLADGIKMFQKENITPRGADQVLHFLVPALSVVPVFMLFVLLPFGKDMVGVELNMGLLFFLAFAGLQAPLLIAAGWAPRNKFSVIGGMRAAAQMLAYGVPMAVSVVTVVMVSGSLSVSGVVAAQAREGFWYIFTPWGLFAFIIYILCATAECKRTPFDMPEAESELVAGFHTEYSGLRWALLFMAEFIAAYAVCGLAATLFFGGWSGPAFIPSWAIFQIKTWGLFCVMIWLRGTLPRPRIDQLLGFAWKFLFPLSLLVLVSAAWWHFLREAGRQVSAFVWPLVGLVAVYWLLSTVIMRELIRSNRPLRGEEDE